MNKIFYFLLLLLLPFVSQFSLSQTVEGNVVTPKGAWCWFADSRALHHQSANINSTYMGYIDVQGNIKAMQQDFLTGKKQEVLIRSYFQPDDHDNPTFLVLPDERIMIFYSRHTDEACFYYRVSKAPGDITTLGPEIRLATSQNTTYPSPFILSDDPNNIYLCWRGINWHPTIARMSIPDANDQAQFNWGPFQIVQSTGARPYCKYDSNGKDLIYMSYTTGHPDNENPNYVYFNLIDINTKQLKDIKGKVLSTVGSGVHNVSATSTYSTANPDAVVENSSFRNWIWQTTKDAGGNPVIAIVRISADKTIHQYYYAKWTGTQWRRTFIANGGGKFHQTAGLELCYSGGMAIDDLNPDIVYCSVPVAGTYGTVYEIFKYVMAADGTVLSSEAVTQNSRLNNSRPFVITNAGNSPLKLAWMNGNYYDWIVSSTRPLGYPTAIHCDYPMPADNKDIENGLLINESFSGTISGTARTSGGVLISTKETYAGFLVQQTSQFSVSLTPYIFDGAYEGTLLKAGDLTYSLDGATLKPYLNVGQQKYTSTNVLGTSDVWQTQARGTGGVWYTPTKLKYFNLTLTYDGSKLRIYRNGLIDQIINIENLTLSELRVGGFMGWVEDCRVYNRPLTQDEIKELTATSLAYTFNNSLLTDIELEKLTVPDNIYTDVVLPVKTSSGTTIAWTSNNAAVLPATGLVNFPTVSTPVTLTATINSQSKQFQVTVMPRDIAQNKLLVYRFEGSDLYTVDNQKYLKDKSGKNNDALIYGNSVVNGNLDLTANTAAAFSTNGFAMAPNGILNNLRSATFMLKIKPSALNNQPRLFDFGSASSNSILLRANAFTAGYKYNGGSTTLINSGTAITAGQESLVAMSFDAKTKTTKIYLNGVQTATSTAITYEPWQLTTISANTRNYIGRTQWWDTSVAAENIDYQGTIDDFMLYDIALSADEIVQVQSNTSAVRAIHSSELRVYPNPLSMDEPLLFLHSDQLNASTMLEVMDVHGRIIEFFNQVKSPVLLRNVTRGSLYFLRLHKSDRIYTTRLLVV